MRGWALLALLAMGSAALAQEEPEEPNPVDYASPEEAVPRRKEWLSAHQSPDGGWSCNGFQSQCAGEICKGTGKWEGEAGSTGLALLAFVGYGETHLTPRYGDVVRRGSARLMEIQDGDGCFGIRYPERFLADHAIATLAMVELGGLTRKASFLRSAERAVGFLLSQRNADGGWRTGDSDPESRVVTTAWAMSALVSARAAEVSVDESVFLGAMEFLDENSGGVSEEADLHCFAREPARLAGTAAILLRTLLKVREPDDLGPERDGRFLLRAYPGGGLAEDPEFWYFGTLACHRIGGDTWKRWNAAMKKAIIDTQVVDRESCRWGSWDPVPGPSEEMGRVATTAFAILCLETYYRYSRVLGSKDTPPEPVRPAPPSAQLSNRAAALDLDFPEPRTGFVR